MLKGELDDFLRKTSPEIPLATRQILSQEMVGALKRWAMADPAKRDQVLKQSERRMERRLGLIPSEIKLGVKLSKKRVGSESAAQQQAKVYLVHFTRNIAGLRAKRGVPSGQLAFRIENVDFTHPKLVEVSCIVSGQDLKLSEMRNAKGHVNHKKAAHPAEVRITADLFQ